MQSRRLFERDGFVHVLTRRFHVVACRGRAHLSTSTHQRCARVKCRLTKCCSRLEIPSICIRATMYPATRGNNGSGAFVLFHSGVAPFMVFIGSVAIELLEQLGWKEVRMRVARCLRFEIFDIWCKWVKFNS